MNKTLAVIKHEFTQTLKRKAFIITTLSLPIIALTGMVIYQVVQEMEKEPDVPEELKIGYVDNTSLFTDFTLKENLTFISYKDPEKARDALLNKELDDLFVIPEDYLQTGRVTRFTTEKELEIPAPIWLYIRDFLLENLFAEEMSEEFFERARNPLNLSSLYLNEAGEISEPPDEFIVIMVPYIFGLLFIISIFLTSGYLLQSVAEEKENRIIEILLSSVSTRQLLVGKVLGLGSAGLIQVAVWFVTIRIFAGLASVEIEELNDLAIPASMLMLGFVYFILGYLMFSVIYAGIGSIAPSARESQQWSGMFVMPAVVPLMLMVLIAEHPDGAIARTMTFIPITAPTTVMMRFPNTTIPVWEIGLSIILLLATTAIGIWLVSRIFRVYLLMYGKRPSFREIIRYAREG